MPTTISNSSTHVRYLAVVALVTATVSGAHAQVSPVGAHHSTVGPGGGLDAPVSPTGGYGSAVNLDLPRPRGPLPVPLSIVVLRANNVIV